MHPVRTQKPVSAETSALRELAAKRQSHWLSVVLSWAGGLVGLLSVFVLVVGARQASALPQAIRPNVGPGFSESATATIGAMLFGGGFACLAFILIGAALVHSTRRLSTVAFALPALLAVALLLSFSWWSPS